ncbi:ATP-binding protein [Thalassotalea euphylliae]|uniref:ATP-binding protein n=1 Tax=Thalassotalea euphylliae TaxID=1655234 RepID=UPI0036304A3C
MDRIFVVIDDSKDDRYVLKRYLKQSNANAKVIEASSSKAGIDVLAQGRADVIFLDYYMPGVDGLSTLVQIKTMLPFVPVIILTGQGDEVVAVSALKNGAADYLKKNNLSPALLHKAVDNAIKSNHLQRQVEEQRIELDRFARVLAHDLKQPSYAVKTMVQLIIQKYSHSLPNEVSDKLHLLVDTSEQMYQLIEALVGYTKLDQKSLTFFAAVNLNKCMGIVLSNLAEKINVSGAQISYDELPKIYAVPSFMVQILQILIDNAIIYCEEVPCIHISATSTVGHWIIDVDDNGIGIPEADRLRAFEPMVRLHDDKGFKGSGLGLATAKRIVDKHNGDISIHSGSKGGALIRFSIAKGSTYDV